MDRCATLQRRVKTWRLKQVTLKPQRGNHARTAQATLAQAESAPRRSLQALRTRMVEELSAGMEVSGPYFVVKHRGMSLHDGDYFR